jgi:hypothetical protein
LVPVRASHRTRTGAPSTPRTESRRDQRQQAFAHRVLGLFHARLGDDAARDAWEQAQAIFEELQHPNAEKVRLKLKALT